MREINPYRGHPSHGWDIPVQEAIRLQRELSGRIRCSGTPKRVRSIAGVDLAFDGRSAEGFCGIVVFSYPRLEVIEERYCRDSVRFPYVPGLLSFREGPLFLKTCAMLSIRPDIIIFDGQGIAHPRRLGIASHMGLILETPSVGCAKSRLFGSFDEPGELKGSQSALRGNDGEIIGAVLRTRDRVRPVFVSPGHLIGVKEAVRLVMSCVDGYRIPLPTRLAHKRVGEYKRSASR